MGKESESREGDLIGQYLAGRLGRRQAAEIDRAIGDDGVLRQEIRGLGQEAARRESQDGEPLPDGQELNRQEVLAALERRMLLRERPDYRWLKRWVAAVAATAAVLAVAFAIGQWRSEASERQGQEFTAKPSPRGEAVVEVALLTRESSASLPVDVEYRMIGDQAGASRPAWNHKRPGGMVVAAHACGLARHAAGVFQPPLAAVE